MGERRGTGFAVCGAVMNLRRDAGFAMFVILIAGLGIAVELDDLQRGECAVAASAAVPRCGATGVDPERH